MTLTPPFYLTGEAGKALGNVGYSLAALGVQDAVLNLRSLDADTLQFSLRDNGNRPAIPDDGQWLTLTDDTGQVLFTGIAKRSFRFPERIYTYEASNVYRGLMETALIEGDRAFVLYSAPELGGMLSDILARGVAAGLPFQAPAVMPNFYPVPKMAFRASSIAGALEDALKWAPDTVTRINYSTSPPTLEFATRTDSSAKVIDLDGEGHKTTGLELTPYPEARALGVAFAYARRDGDNVVNFLVQSAGDDTAEARRKVSLYLSGLERSDMLVTEALTTAQKAVAMAQASVDAVGASIDAAAATAQIAITWTNLRDRDSNLSAAVTAEPGYTMGVGSFGRTLYTGIGCGGGSPWTTTASVSKSGPALYTSGGSLATGWYPIVTGAFTAPELTTAGATKETRFIRGWLYKNVEGGSAGFVSLPSGSKTDLSGYSQSYISNCALTNDYYEAWGWYYCDIAVDAINMAPSAVAAAVKAAAASGSSSLIERAEFVEAPPDLAANYFARQDWTPYKGRLTLTPTAPDFPAPGDFLNIRGEGTPAEWATMKVPVAELSIDLLTGSATVTIGPSPRMDFSSLVDRLRIPPEDNYQPG